MVLVLFICLFLFSRKIIKKKKKKKTQFCIENKCIFVHYYTSLRFDPLLCRCHKLYTGKVESLFVYLFHHFVAFCTAMDKRGHQIYSMRKMQGEKKYIPSDSQKRQKKNPNQPPPLPPWVASILCPC